MAQLLFLPILYHDIIKKIPDGSEIEFIVNDGKKFSIRSGKSKFSLSCLPKKDFPLIEIEKLDCEFSLDSNVFLNLIEKTRFAISNEETRYFLNGVYFHKKNLNNVDNLSLVATDGHRLAKIDLPYPNGLIDLPGVIIPKKTIYELCKLLTDINEEIIINIDPNKIIFYIGKTTLISKLIDGNFPDYQRVIPENNNNIVTAEREKFSEVVDRVSTITSEKTRAIKFRLLKNLINMTSSDPENGTATEDMIVHYEGEEIEIGFNSKYLLEMINQLDEEKLILEFSDSASPLIVRESSSNDLIYVLMPMRV